MSIFRLSIFATLFLSACGELPSFTSEEVSSPPPPPVALEFDQETLNAIDALQVGSTKAEVMLALGNPTGEVAMGNSEILYYHGVQIKMTHQQVSEMPDDLVIALKEGYKKSQAQALALAEKKAAEQAQEQGVEVKGQANRNIRQGGSRINIAPLIGNGKITIVDFYADWCGPCKQAEPHLKKLAQDPNVTLIQIDIVRWGTPVTTQYNLNSIPNMRVFDASGKQIGKETHSVSAIRKYVKEAKKRS
ncbi:thioredoxin domain-containing protein [Kiritimatiellota bacterium B12222]|nr:thioredoxin domain-containing protein [Kiritimatiellota bacterium B12222]